MITIHKFPLELAEVQQVKMPRGAKVIHVADQVGGFVHRPTLWAIVDTDAPLAIETFAVVGTEKPIPVDSGEYIGTTHADNFVWHIFQPGN